MGADRPPGTGRGPAGSSASEPSRRRSRSTAIEGQLLAAALELLATQGVGALTVRSVAARAGVAPAGVYSRYDGKSGLLDALTSQGFDLLHGALVGASGPSALARLRAACLAYREFALSHPHHYRLMFTHKPDLDLSEGTLQRARTAFAELAARVRDCLDAGSLGAGTQDDDHPDTADAGGLEVELAQRVWSSLHGAISLELNGIGFTPDAAATYRGLVATLLAGLGATA